MNNQITDLSRHRLSQAKQCIESARILSEAGDYRGAANRSYYCIFHSMRSVLALEQKDFSKHSGVIAYFRKEFIKTGIFNVILSDIITEAFDTRSDCDYDDYYVISRKEVEQQIANAEIFYTEVQKYLSNKNVL